MLRLRERSYGRGYDAERSWGVKLREVHCVWGVVIGCGELRMREKWYCGDFSYPRKMEFWKVESN